MKPRKSPCASCPYRRDVPSGLWAESEYAKLRTFDGSTQEQADASAWGVFACHQSGGSEVCAGWAHVHGNVDCLALRMARGLDPAVDVMAVLDYETSVPLWPSGAAAADHGMREIDAPGKAAQQAVEKIIKVRAGSDHPVQFKEEP